MALLTDNIAPTSNASSMIAKFGEDMQRMQYYRDQENQRQELKAERAAEYRGEATAVINSLQNFDGLYNVAQGMYSTYLDFENSGDIENAAMVKKQLEMTLKAMQGYTANFIDQRNSLSDDKVLSGFDNDYQDLQSIADEYQKRGYTYVGFQDGSHIIEDENGQQMTVEQIPGVSDGSTFINDDRVQMRENLPDGYSDAYDIAGQYGSKVLTGDVMDDYGRITDENLLREKVGMRFAERIALKPGQLYNMIYLDQRAKGNMDSFDLSTIKNLAEDDDYTGGLINNFVDDTVVQIKGSIQQRDTPSQVSSKEKYQAVNELEVQNGEITTAKSPIRFSITTPIDPQDPSQGDMGKSMYIMGITKDSNGLPVVRNSVMSGEGAQASTKIENLPLTKGSELWKGMSDYFGGERYLIQALKRMGVDVNKYRM
jgi:hypothetical protein